MRRGIPYVCSPIVQDNKLYLVKKGGFVTCVDTTTGKPIYSQERLGVGGEYYATPITVGDRIFIAAERGTVFVIKPSDKLEIIAETRLAKNWRPHRPSSMTPSISGAINTFGRFEKVKPGRPRFGWAIITNQNHP